MKKIASRISLGLVIYFLSFPAKSFGQSLSSEDIKVQIIKDWERAKIYTTDYLNDMPAEKYNFRPVDSIRSFAQQMLHLATGNIFLMSNATDQAAPSFEKSDPEHSPTAQSKDSVMYYVIASYDYCIDAVKNLPTSKWGEKKKIFSYDETRFALMMKAFEHQTHHRGQTTIYFRLLGIPPRGEKLFQ
jgi:uncharacterized damage-inducible protein DinB